MSSQESNVSDASQPAKSTPKDALVMASILKEMGVTEYEPRVVNQMIEFAYRYVTDVVEDARVYATHANRKTINIDDVKLSVSQKLDHAFTSPPPREFLLEIARTKNAQPLNLVPEKSGLRIPPERYCLLGTNYKIKSQTKKVQQAKKQANQSARASTKGAASITNTSSAGIQDEQSKEQQQQNGSVGMIQQQSQPVTTATNQQQQQQMIQQQQQQQQQSLKQKFPAMLKRKHEADDDYD